MHRVTVIGTGVAYGLTMWTIVRLLQGSKSREALAVAIVTGLVVLVLNLLGGTLVVPGIVLTTVIA